MYCPRCQAARCLFDKLPPDMHMGRVRYGEDVTMDDPLAAGDLRAMPTALSPQARRAMIVAYIQKNGPAQVHELTEAVGCSLRTIQRDTAFLAELGMLCSIGYANTTHWAIVRSN